MTWTRFLFFVVDWEHSQVNKDFFLTVTVN